MSSIGVMEDIILKAIHIKKVFINKTNRIEVLKDVNFFVRRKEILSIVGPSGAGKTTLLHILAGLCKPTEGEVLFDNRALHTYSEKEISLFRNRKIGFVFQFYHLLE